MTHSTDALVILLNLNIYFSEISYVFIFTAIVQNHEPTNPCNPSPCGLNAVCENIAGNPICRCLPEYINSPPNCRYECIINSECPLDKSCINRKCVDPCPNSCGIHANCKVINHIPNCYCPNSLTGNPLSQCSPITSKFIQAQRN